MADTAKEGGCPKLKILLESLTAVCFVHCFVDLQRHRADSVLPCFCTKGAFLRAISSKLHPYNGFAGTSILCVHFQPISLCCASACFHVFWKLVFDLSGGCHVFLRADTESHKKIL